MRTWQEIETDALATGTYAGYVGDGFTIPWQTGYEVNPVIGGVLFVWKAWLDATYPEAARLHDWCYTPYGSLIQVTRDEADEAIRTRMLAYGGSLASIDSGLVYAGCRLGGEPYFGTSQTGFSQGVYLDALQRASGIVSGPNMPSAGTTVARGSGIGEGVYFVGDPSMAIKVVIVFQQTTKKGVSVPYLQIAGREHIGGWTEHVWFPSDSVTQCMDALTKTFGGEAGLLPARADFLCDRATILGVRLYQGGAGKGQFRSAAFGGNGGPGDIPQMALLGYCQLQNSATPKRMVFRGIPDDAVTEGEWNGGPGVNWSIAMFARSLANFGAMGADAVQAFPVFGVTGAGTVTLNGVNNPFAVGSIVTFRNVVNDTTGQRNGGAFVVASVGPMNNQFAVTGWNFGNCSGGDVRIPTSSVHAIVASSLAISRVVTRKVGRPFELYRGRRSKRKVPA